MVDSQLLYSDVFILSLLMCITFRGRPSESSLGDAESLVDALNLVPVPSLVQLE